MPQSPGACLRREYDNGQAVEARSSNYISVAVNVCYTPLQEDPSMAVIAVPRPLREKLGEDGTDAVGDID